VRGYFLPQASFGLQQTADRRGNCPDLRLPHAVTHDATHANWLLKKSIFAQSQVHLISPSKWLMNKTSSYQQPVFCRTELTFPSRNHTSPIKTKPLILSFWLTGLKIFKDYTALDQIQAQTQTRPLSCINQAQLTAVETTGPIQDPTPVL
jgi:hypothetical protein